MPYKDREKQLEQMRKFQEQRTELLEEFAVKYAELYADNIRETELLKAAYKFRIHWLEEMLLWTQEPKFRARTKDENIGWIKNGLEGLDQLTQNFVIKVATELDKLISETKIGVKQEIAKGLWKFIKNPDISEHQDTILKELPGIEAKVKEIQLPDPGKDIAKKLDIINKNGGVE